jgi:hypothetical protein
LNRHQLKYLNKKQLQLYQLQQQLESLLKLQKQHHLQEHHKRQNQLQCQNQLQQQLKPQEDSQLKPTTNTIPGALQIETAIKTPRILPASLTTITTTMPGRSQNTNDKNINNDNIN